MHELYNDDEVGRDEAEENNHQLDVDGKHAAYFVVYWSRFHVTKEIYDFHVLFHI